MPTAWPSNAHTVPLERYQRARAARRPQCRRHVQVALELLGSVWPPSLPRSFGRFDHLQEMNPTERVADNDRVSGDSANRDRPVTRKGRQGSRGLEIP